MVVQYLHYKTKSKIGQQKNGQTGSRLPTIRPSEVCFSHLALLSDNIQSHNHEKDLSLIDKKKDTSKYNSLFQLKTKVFQKV